MPRRISANAAEAARLAGVSAIALRRPAWEKDARRPLDVGRQTLPKPSQSLGVTPRKVFLALGRQELAPFEVAPQHAYLIRSVDPVEPPLGVPDATYILARGPFSEADDRALLEAHGIDAIVAKNSGGQATYGKIAAARALGVEVFLIRRPPLPDMPSGASVEEVLRLADHALTGAEKARRIDQRGLVAALDDARLRRADDHAGRHVRLRRVRLAERRRPRSSRPGVRRRGRR